MSAPFNAVPTVYRNVKMRSRAEADTARLLDLLNIPWRYESTTVVLPDGQEFRPDFVLPHPHSLMQPTWLEVRGYEHGESVEQIRSVARFVAAGQLPCAVFATVTALAWQGQIAAAFFGTHEHTYYSACETNWSMALCTNCRRGRVILRGFARSVLCPYCFHQENTEARVHITNGYVAIRNLDSWNDESSVRVCDLAVDENMVALFERLPFDDLEDSE